MHQAMRLVDQGQVPREGDRSGRFRPLEQRGLRLLPRATPSNALRGGIHARQTFHPGFHASGVLHDCGLVRARLLADLGLESHGLRWGASSPSVHCSAGAVDPARLAPSAARGLARMLGFAERMGGILADLLDEAPPSPAPGAGELLALAQRAFRLRRLGADDLTELMRVAPMCARDWCQENEVPDPLAAALVGPELVGTVIGPRAAGSAALVLLAHAARAAEPAGGSAGLVDALLSAARTSGVTLGLAHAARRVLFANGRAAGVELADGSRLDAGTIVSALDARHTLLELVEPGRLAPELEREVRGWRTRGSTAVLRLALARPPRFAAADGPVERFVTATSLAGIERTADALKYGELPASPWLDVRVPSLSDASLAPSGAAVLTALAHGVSHALRSPSPEVARERLLERLLRELESAAPGVRASIVAHELLLPADLEARFGLAGGQIMGGELALDQLWCLRPSLALARYATPIHGLFLGGASSHPGGPFLGGAGVLAARAIAAA
jgi:phytoene dehydrogenase-like protein